MALMLLGIRGPRCTGKEFAKRVVDTFGLDTLAVIEETPERLLEVLWHRHLKRMERIRDHWARPEEQRGLCHPARHHIGRALAGRIVEKYGDKAPTIITHSPTAWPTTDLGCRIQDSRWHRQGRGD